ncbi:non-homologous end-joining DNA ligase [Geoglobus ahangari]
MSWFDEKIRPMLAKRGEPFDSPDFIYELKLDGTRCIAFVDVERRRVRMQNRRLFEIAYRYPEIDLLSAFDDSVVVDGEIVVLKNGVPDFSLLQKREHVDSESRVRILSKLYPAVYFVFDILYSSGRWTMKRPLSERKEILGEVLSETEHVLKVESFREKGVELFSKAVSMGFEGLVAKRIDSPYRPGVRSDEWLKIKKRRTMDCVITGYLEGEGQREGLFGSLVLAVYDGETLIHVGQVGTGFSSDFLREFTGKLREIEIQTPHFSESFARPVHWVKPVYVCEVEYLELMKDCKLRAPVFRRLRYDKSPEDCTAEQIEECIKNRVVD